jgi:hypothetical protein
MLPHQVFRRGNFRLFLFVTTFAGLLSRLLTEQWNAECADGPKRK